jgi:nucleoside 2-deoxyribosyltransferase
MRKIYLAGPDVFLPDAKAIGARKKALCTRYGFVGLYPLDNEIVAAAGGARLDLLIYRANEALIREADLGICNLTPFRGPSADGGTVYELGLLVGLGKPVFAYTNSAEDYLERVRERHALTFDAALKTWRDENDMMVEDFGNADNLMIDGALLDHGCPIVRHRATPDALFHDLTGFEACLRLASETPSKPV